MDFFIFIVFLTYIGAIFFINNYILLLTIFIINIVVMLFARVHIRKIFYHLISISIFAIFIILVNVFAMSFKEAVFIGIKVLLICSGTYAFSKVMTTMRMISALEKFLKPFGAVGIECRDIGILICIVITFIPIFKDEMKQTLYAMKAKGIKVGISNIGLIVEPIIHMSLKRAGDVEASLKAKSYLMG